MILSRNVFCGTTKPLLPAMIADPVKVFQN
jgi:hypothetical protein